MYVCMYLFIYIYIYIYICGGSWIHTTAPFFFTARAADVVQNDYITRVMKNTFDRISTHLYDHF